jgi:serine/threonine protein kinase, bacterial
MDVTPPKKRAAVFRPGPTILRTVSRTGLSAAVIAAGIPLASIGTASAADPVLDGLYRVDYDGPGRIVDGAPDPTVSTYSIYAFRSSCGASGCIANGIQTQGNDETSMGVYTYKVSLRYSAGHWAMSTPHDLECPPTGETIQDLVSWSLEPHDDGTLTGIRSEAMKGTHCPTDTSKPTSQPIRATRIGDVPADVTVPAS